MGKNGIGGCGNTLYYVEPNSSGSGTDIYKYNGSGNASIVTTITNNVVVYDVVADCNCNFYLLSNTTPQYLTQYNPNGTALCSYSITNPVYPIINNNPNFANGGLAMIGNTIYVRTNTAGANTSNTTILSGSPGGGGFYAGVINGSSITFTAINGFPPVTDFASCPVCNTNSITVSTSSGSISCASSTAALTVSVNTVLSPVTYSWAGPGVVAGTATNAIATASVSGNYTCTINAGGCLPGSPPTQTIVNTNVLSNTLPPVSLINPSGNICINGITPMYATPANNIYTYTWSGGSIVSGANADTVYVNSAGIYSLQVGDTINHCVYSTTVNTFAAPSLSLNLSSNTLCAQNINGSPNSITLTAGGAVNYTLLTSPHYSSSAANASIFPIVLLPPFLNFNSPETATLIADNGTCSNTITNSFSIIANPTLSILPQSASICAGQSKTLSASGASSYTWLPNNNLNSGFSANVIANPSITSVYTINAQNAYACYANATTLSIVVKPLPVLNVSPVNTSICINSGTAAILTSGTATLFSWSPTLGLSSGSIANPLAHPSVSTIYTLSGTLDGCTNIATASVYVVPPPNLNLSLSSNSFCAQAFNGSPNSITLTASGASAYTLNTPAYVHNPNPGGPSSPISLTPPFNNTGPATATLFGSNGVCSVSTSVVFTVVPNPSLTAISPTPVICAGQSFTYTSSGANSFVWSSSTPGSTLYTTGNVAVANPIINSVFSVYGGSLGCNSALQTTSITVNPLPNVSISPNPTFVCLGKAVNLQALGNGSSFVWSSLSLPNFNSNPTVNVSPVKQETYSVIAALNNCTNSAMATVSVLPLPNPSISINANTLCLNQDLQLSGSGAKFYAWTSPNNFVYSGAVVKIPMYNLSYAGNYTLSAIDSNACEARTITNISLLNLPSGYLKSNQTNFCVPFCSEYQFVLNQNTNSGISGFNWRINDVFLSSSKSFSYCFTKAGNYQMKGDLQADNGCVNSILLNVTAYPKPKADFDFSPDKPIENVDEVEFIAAKVGVKEFRWVFGTGPSTSSGTGPSTPSTGSGSGSGSGSASGFLQYKLFENAGLYPIVLVVSNEYNCMDTIIKPITVLPDLAVYVPNAFTPNADRKNDTFMPVVRAAQSIHFEIYNRWGEKIFETQELNVGWDGTYKGQDCKEDVYVWKLKVTGLSGQDHGTTSEKDYSGQVLLVR